MKPPSDYKSSTVAYYESHAEEFSANTLNVDMSGLYDSFLGQIRPGGRILDAGCGSGRDSLAFIARGYRVVSIDASPAMVAATSKLTGRGALLLTFDDLNFEDEFDGIWACASLLHVSRLDLPTVLNRLVRAMAPSAVLYMSFKYGDSERIENGRFFNDLDETLFQVMIRHHPQLEILSVWRSDDVRRSDRPYQRWLNALTRKTA
jgi:SAM-dependent methyltransferase